MTAARRILTALFFGALTHGLFALAVGLMIYHLFFGLSASWGSIPYPYAVLANALLVLQFPILHSFLLTDRGRKILALIGPDERLATSHYAIIASIQLAVTFAFWSPSGVILWQAEGLVFWLMCAAYASAWGLLGLSILQSGFQLQSGMLGWFAMLRDRAPKFPDLPTRGLYRLIRQPIYASFALTLWTMPTYTPDQLALAVFWTTYCVAAPLHKERRFTKIYGDRFAAFQARTPYFIPFTKARHK